MTDKFEGRWKYIESDNIIEVDEDASWPLIVEPNQVVDISLESEVVAHLININYYKAKHKTIDSNVPSGENDIVNATFIFVSINGQNPVNVYTGDNHGSVSLTILSLNQNENEIFAHSCTVAGTEYRKNDYQYPTSGGMALKEHTDDIPIDDLDFKMRWNCGR